MGRNWHLVLQDAIPSHAALVIESAARRELRGEERSSSIQSDSPRVLLPPEDCVDAPMLAVRSVSPMPAVHSRVRCRYALRLQERTGVMHPRRRKRIELVCAGISAQRPGCCCGSASVHPESGQSNQTKPTARSLDTGVWTPCCIGRR